MRSRAFRLLVIATALFSFLIALTFAVAPQWHEQFHVDAANQQHECAVSLIVAGKCHHAAPPDLVAAPSVAVVPSILPALHSVWVEAPFLGASIFEHAPPALS